MVQRKTTVVKTPWPQPPSATKDRDLLAASLLDEIAADRNWRNEQAEAFVQVARLAHAAVNETFVDALGTEAERLALARSRLSEIVARCLAKEIEVRPRINVLGVAYYGPLTYVCGGGETLMMTVTGPRSGFYFSGEGVGWIRGHHKPDSPEVKTLLARRAQAGM